jgi:hypothetical protein
MGVNRLERNYKYLSFYYAHQRELDFDEIVLFDNASDTKHVSALVGLFPHVNFVRFSESMTRGGFRSDYMYMWRALYSLRLFDADKFIHIDSDGYILTERLFDFVRNCNLGWVSFSKDDTKWAETGFHILNRGAFHIHDAFFAGGYRHLNGRDMETTVPFTHRERGFNCWRHNEDFKPDTEADFYMNVPPGYVPTVR